MMYIYTVLDSSTESKTSALEFYQKFIFIAKLGLAQDHFSTNTLYHVIERHL